MRKSLVALATIGCMGWASNSYAPIEWPSRYTSGAYPKKPNKLSQKALRKRKRQKGR